MKHDVTQYFGFNVEMIVFAMSIKLCDELGLVILIFQFVSHPQKSIFLSFIFKRYPTIPINEYQIYYEIFQYYVKNI